MMQTILRHFILGPVYIYRWVISPFLPSSCRFQPTCSEYALTAILRFGPIKGGALTVTRLLCCHPWGHTGFDPVPDLPQNGNSKGTKLRDHIKKYK